VYSVKHEVSAKKQTYLTLAYSFFQLFSYGKVTQELLIIHSAIKLFYARLTSCN